MIGVQETLEAPPTPEQIIEAAVAHSVEVVGAPPIWRYCLFSGGHDSSVLAHRCRDMYDELAYIDTGTAVPGVREFVEDFARWIDKPLRVLEAGPAWRLMVVGGEHNGKTYSPQGFPGPNGHSIAYSRLKERQVEQLMRDTKARLNPPRRHRVMLLTGTRKDESARRMRTQSAWFRARSSQLWTNPIMYFRTPEMRAYRAEHGLPESDVAALLHRSGECNCGAFAQPGEREELRSLWPEWFDETIAALERESEAAGIPRCRWGDTGGDYSHLSAGDAGPMCTDCQLRLDVTAP